MKKTVKVSKVETVKAGKVDRVILHYEVLDGPKKGEVWKIGALGVKLEESTRNKLKTLKGGEVVDITMAKDGNYWNLTKVEEAGSAPAQSNSGGNSKGGSTSAARYDDTGVKVGAARNQAIAHLSATKGKEFTLDDVDATAYEIIERQAAQEATVRAGNNPAKPEALAEQSQQQSYDDSEVTDEFGF